MTNIKITSNKFGQLTHTIAKQTIVSSIKVLKFNQVEVIYTNIIRKNVLFILLTIDNIHFFFLLMVNMSVFFFLNNNTYVFFLTMLKMPSNFSTCNDLWAVTDFFIKVNTNFDNGGHCRNPVKLENYEYL